MIIMNRKIMRIKAELNYLHVSPRKVRVVASLLKGMDVGRARATLKYLKKRSSLPLLKLLNSAVAGAKHNFNLSENKLFIDSVIVNSGPVFKRSRARAFGRASMIHKRTSHIILGLVSDETMPGGKKISRKKSDISVRELKNLSDIKEELVETKDAGRHDRETSEKAPVKKQQGFVKKMFRRKAI